MNTNAGNLQFELCNLYYVIVIMYVWNSKMHLNVIKVKALNRCSS